MIEDLTATSFSTTTASMGAISVFNLIRALNVDTPKQKLSNSLSTLINVIAFIHYLRMRKQYDDGKKDIVGVRYSDWFVTCPLLLIEYCVLMEWITFDENNNIILDFNEIFNISICIVLTLSMLVFGYLAEKNPDSKNIYFSLGFISLILLYCSLYFRQRYIKREDKKNYPIFFILIWSLYGLVFLLPSYRDLFYNILDFIAKVVFAFFIGCGF